ncbi:MAG: preprotein translocase subunit SecE [Acidobacteria bacterium]|nr:MAG: preprotein translocase subunit SecE [Acidobacteriota bacterium]
MARAFGKRTADRHMADELGIQKNSWIRLREYFSEVRVEMKRVTWPSWQEVYGTTIMVLVATFLFGLYFELCDVVFQRLVQRVLNFFLGK